MSVDTGRNASLDLIVKLRGETQVAGVSKISSAADRSTSLAKRTGIDIQLKRRISETMLAEPCRGWPCQAAS
jgi:hypothetical protein